MRGIHSLFAALLTAWIVVRQWCVIIAVRATQSAERVCQRFELEWPAFAVAHVPALVWARASWKTRIDTGDRACGEAGRIGWTGELGGDRFRLPSEWLDY
jgi:hypothetical protein